MDDLVLKVTRVYVSVTVMVRVTLEVREGEGDTVEEADMVPEREGDTVTEGDREEVGDTEVHTELEVDMEGEREAVGQREMEGEGEGVLEMEGVRWGVEEWEGEALSLEVRDRVREDRGDLEVEAQWLEVRERARERVAFEERLGVTVRVGAKGEVVLERVGEGVEEVDRVIVRHAEDDCVQGCVVACEEMVAVAEAEGQVEGLDTLNVAEVEVEEE